MTVIKVLFISVLILVFCSPVFSLKRDSINSLNHVIKVNVVALSFNEFNLAFEQRIKNSIWLGLNGGVVYTHSILSGRQAPFVAEGAGYVARAYITARNLFRNRENLYLSGLLMYKQLSYDHIWWANGSNSDSECTIESGNQYASGLRIIFGFTPLFPKIFVFDLYAGLGINYEIVKRNIHNEGYGTDCADDKSAVTKNNDSSRFMPTIHTGLNIGIGW